MRFLESWITTSSAEAVGRTLLHFIWEGALIALLLTLVFWCTRAARVRYAAACVAMLAMPIAFGVTLWRSAPDQIVQRQISIPRFPTLAAVPSSPAAAPSEKPVNPLPWLAPIWIAGVTLLYARSLAGWLAAQRFRRIGVCSADSDWQDRVHHLSQMLRLSRPVLLLESCLTEVPVVIGFFRPVILMPVGLLTGFPPEQVEAFLIHELAHVRRHDYLVNLMQSLIEGLLFYHPAVWWISGLVRAERENCCDDIVVRYTGNAHGYAAALTTLEQKRWLAAEAALAVTGGNLMKRIHRLLSQDRPRTAAVPVVGLLLLSACLGLAAWKPNHPSPVPMTEVAVTQPAPESTPARPAPLLAQAAKPAPIPQAPVLQTDPYQKWLDEEVVYIISPEERSAFGRLLTNDERQMFIQQFWLRRDPTPGTEQNEYREEHYRRVAYANASFGFGGTPGWNTHRGAIYIVFGPPDELDRHPNGGTYDRPIQEGGGTTNTFPFEAWHYRYIQGLGTNVTLEFVDSSRTGNYILTMDPAEKDALLNLPRNQANVQNLPRFSRVNGAQVTPASPPTPASAAPPATPATADALRAGAGVSMPALVQKVEPQYSEEARKAKWQGTVVLSLIVDQNGRPQNTKVTRSLGLGLDEEAIKAVEQWVFKPGMKDGQAVPVYAAVEVKFALPDDAANVPTFRAETLADSGKSGAYYRPQTDSSVAGATAPVFARDTSMPALIRKVEPAYSEEARKAKWQGTVVLSVVVDESGRTQDIRVTKSLGLGLDEEAIRAVSQWTFLPGMKDGKPVPVATAIEVEFKLL